MSSILNNKKTKVLKKVSEVQESFLSELSKIKNKRDAKLKVILKQRELAEVARVISDIKNNK